MKCINICYIYKYMFDIILSIGFEVCVCVCVYSDELIASAS